LAVRKLENRRKGVAKSLVFFFIFEGLWYCSFCGSTCLSLTPFVSLMSQKFIDIEKAIALKNPALLKWMPGFLLRYIKRVTHEEWLNSVLNKHLSKTGLEFTEALVHEFEMDVTLTGAEHIPATGGVILASNHPLGGMDGIAFLHAIGKIRPDVRLLVNDLLMTFNNFSPLFVPVNKHGKNSIEANRKIEEVYEQGYAVLIFPAGMVSRKQEGGIKDLLWRKSFISKAVKNKLDIVPCHISGRNSPFFYNLANFRKKVGLKANLEMFWLVDEMYHQRKGKIDIKLGKPVSYTHFETSETDAHWADYMKAKVYELGTPNA